VGDVILKPVYSALVGAALLLIAAAPVSAQVTNGGFEDSAITTLSGSLPGNMGVFANGWGGWNNNGLPVTISDASPGTDPFAPGGDHMAHIITGGANDGLYQLTVFQSLSADFFVVSGAAQLTAILGFSSVPGTVSTTQTGVWQHLTLNFSGIADELVLYSSGGPSEFYVDNIVSGAYNPDLPASSVTTFGAVPEPASWALMIGGFGMAGAALRRRRTAVAA
jgi:hypothetical protein